MKVILTGKNLDVRFTDGSIIIGGKLEDVQLQIEEEKKRGRKSASSIDGEQVTESIE